ncbi:hypothetical protein I862_01340 [endosymbiont of Acanthamoeba sp. UWC8]|uniref:hypothetical protein n=1 Tax=endosymbiont of Acanthamoeba sp. UWC8 TaxID=86106 RepID=UPI0004D16BBD|nr:hypothetical protein [endosymbiont of Acanthamoeba sp. UWC8]AIF80831.1 hypothetical protein I862_01340 [endosymbiont of Acanthamoeba sp. UWC8]
MQGKENCHIKKAEGNIIFQASMSEVANTPQYTINSSSSEEYSTIRSLEGLLESGWRDVLDRYYRDKILQPILENYIKTMSAEITNIKEENSMLKMENDRLYKFIDSLKEKHHAFVDEITSLQEEKAQLQKENNRLLGSNYQLNILVDELEAKKADPEKEPTQPQEKLFFPEQQAEKEAPEVLTTLSYIAPVNKSSFRLHPSESNNNPTINGEQGYWQSLVSRGSIFPELSK